MKVPLNWLRDYVNLTLPVAELAERLTLAGLEVSGVRVIGLPVPQGLRTKAEDAGPVWARDKILIGEVLKVEPHPDPEVTRLTLPTVNYGAAQPKKLLTGAPNIKVGDHGQKVIVALAGSVLFDGHAKEKVLRELKSAKIRGIESDAMVCSAYELGISDEHEGIIILEDDAPVGTPLADFMGDIVLELDVTPNLARCLCLIGVAREVAAITGQAVCIPRQHPPATGESIAGKVSVSIEDAELSARYAAMLIQGVKVSPAPGWMQRRLTYAGMRPINNLVDITNYVMLEWGQPLHAFDYDALVRRAAGKAPQIIVRPARAGEVLVTLDNVKRELTPDNLLIADSAGPIALAGVMGGLETEVSATTTNVLLESANFDFISIRRTMKVLNLPSEASVRFSRGIHPETVRPAAERAAALMQEHAGGKVCKGIVDCYPRPLPPQIVHLALPEVRRILGMEFAPDQATRILQALDFQVQQAADGVLMVTSPPHRLDIQEGPADLIEDLARIHGYDRLPATLLADQLPEGQGDYSLAVEERARSILVNAGLQEAITYSLTAPEREALLGLQPAEYVRLLNPISSERVVMRQSVLAGLLDVTAANLRHTENIRLFEIGSIYLPRPGVKLPDEPRRLALVLTGRRAPEFWTAGADKAPALLDFFDLKGVVEALVGDLHVSGVAYRPSATAYLHTGRAAELVVQGRVAGHFGQLHPRIALKYELGPRTILVGEFDLELILAAVPSRYTYRPVPRFPAALRDISVLMPLAITAEQVLAEIRAAGGDLLRDVRLFDVYRGESIPAEYKSLTYALTYLAEDRTLTDKEVDKAHKKIEDRLKHVLKAQIRGQDGGVSG